MHSHTEQEAISVDSLIRLNGFECDFINRNLSLSHKVAKVDLYSHILVLQTNREVLIALLDSSKQGIK